MQQTTLCRVDPFRVSTIIRLDDRHTTRKRFEDGDTFGLAIRSGHRKNINLSEELQFVGAFQRAQQLDSVFEFIFSDGLANAINICLISMAYIPARHQLQVWKFAGTIQANERIYKQMQAFFRDKAGEESNRQRMR